jgi:hypothetical protein
MEEIMLEVGDFVEAQWLQGHLASLAGVQPKFAARERSVAGRVVSIRGDHPTDPTEILIGVRSRTDPEGETVWIETAWVTSIVKQEKP